MTEANKPPPGFFRGAVGDDQIQMTSMAEQFRIHGIAALQQIAAKHERLFASNISACSKEFLPRGRGTTKAGRFQTSVNATIKAVPV